MNKTNRLRLIIVSIIGIAIILAAVFFKDWPEKQVIHKEGKVLNFEIGMSKANSFHFAIESQNNNDIVNLELLDAPPTTYDKKYKGVLINPEDFNSISFSNEWHLGIPNENAWLTLHFKDETLIQIIEHEWTGPTK